MILEQSKFLIEKANRITAKIKNDLMVGNNH